MKHGQTLAEIFELAECRALWDDENNATKTPEPLKKDQEQLRNGHIKRGMSTIKKLISANHASQPVRP
ncbi:hypothetical protein ACFX13_038482 [Malus domestica]